MVNEDLFFFLVTNSAKQDRETFTFTMKKVQGGRDNFQLIWGVVFVQFKEYLG